MFDAAIFLFVWLGIGGVVYAVMHAVMDEKMDDDNLELILGAVFWPVVIFAPLAALLYVLISYIREKIMDRFEKKRT